MANVGETVEVEPCVSKKYIVKCRSRKLITMIEDFNQVQREAVRRIGFGGLLELTVPISNEAEVRLLKDRWRREFGIRQPGAPIPVGKLAAAIEGDVEGGDRFVRLFVVYYFSAFLCPTKNGSVDLRLLAAVENVSLINQYD